MQSRFFLTGLTLLAACSAPLSSYTTQVEEWSTLEIGFLQSPQTTSQAAEGSFEALFQRARFQNPGLFASWQKWRAAIEVIPQAGGLPDPKLQVGLFLSSLETKEGSTNNRLSLQQAFPWPGTLNLAAQAAALQAEAAREDYLAKELDLRAMLRKLCAENSWLSSSIQFTQAHLDLLSEMESVVRKRWEDGAATHGSLLKIQIELALLEESLASLKDRQLPLLAEMNTLLNRAPAHVVEWPKDSILPTFIFDSTQLLRSLEQNNPSLRALDFLVQSHQVNVEVAKLGLLPNLSIGVDWTGIQDNGSGSDSGKDAFALGVGIELPIQQHSRKSRIRKATAILAATRSQKIQTVNSFRSKLEAKFFQLRDAERGYDLHKNGLIPKGHQALESTMVSYQAGNASFLDFLDTQRTLLNSELAVLRAEADRTIALAEISALSGTKFLDQ
ncbi:MAG: TolC family protein [Planctomycetota bacterium]|jgi:outer membrane protein TolC|nr:TolC family protein [Planctomycetota bacterium]